MKKVLIYSPGSFDIEVLNNVIQFYSGLGFICQICYGKIKRKYKVSRFIYLRDPLNGNSLELVSSEICDIFDYSKTIDENSLSCLFNYFTEVNYISLTRPAPNFSCDYNYIKGYHPVITNLWANKISKKDISLIYIGSRKSSIRFNKEDNVYMEFENLLLDKYSSRDIKVYGNGWKDLDIKIVKLNMSKVSTYYSKSKAALGVLWDIQRYRTLNSRYFYAPLNGCLLFCEDKSNLLDVPGIYGYDEMESIVENFSIEQSVDLQLKAIDFWDKENHKIASQLSLHENNIFFARTFNSFLLFLINAYFRLK